MNRRALTLGSVLALTALVGSGCGNTTTADASGATFAPAKSFRLADDAPAERSRA